MSVSIANSPEGKEGHNSQGHQQLDQQDGIDLGEGTIMWGVRETPVPRDSFEPRPTYRTLSPSFIGVTGQIETSGGAIKAPDPQVQPTKEPRGHGARALGEISEAYARRSHGLGWRERGKRRPADRGWAKDLAGVQHRAPDPSPCPPPQSTGEVVTFLMKSRRTFWSSQLKVVKSSWFPVGKAS